MPFKRYFLNLAYLGTPFRGSQRQVKRSVPRIEDPTTVQGRIEMGLSTLNLTHEPVVFMASRTDAGVHALNSTCHVDLQRQNDMIYEPDIITLCLNRYFLKGEVPIRITNTKIVPNEFHCKKNAISRTYLYRILVAKHNVEDTSTLLHFMPIEEFGRTLFYGHNTESFCIMKMRQAAKMFEGFHDFRTFMGKTKDQDRYTRREILSIEIIERERKEIGVSPLFSWPKSAAKNSGPENHVIIDIYFKGKGFLYKQVRRTAATILTAATGQISLRDIKFMLEVPSKHSWCPQIKTLPAHGLYLCDIDY